MDNNSECSILLQILEGIGLNDNNDEILLNATLNGVKFEVEGHNTENSTIFNSNCIWECTFEDLKKMKTDNLPIKIECFHKTQKNGKEIKKAIGFILLRIRGLQVVKTLKNLQIKLHWHTLCGLASKWRQLKPEIYLSAIITTKELIESGHLEEFLDPVTRPAETSDSIYIRPSETSLMLQSQQGIYIKLLEDECLLQVGSGPDDCDRFVVTLTLKSAKHLDQLVGPAENRNPLFRFHYDFLGGPSDLMLVPNSDGVYNISERILVSFKSSLESLRAYFRRVFYIPIDLYFNDSIIGNYKFSCLDLLPATLDVFNNNTAWEVKDSFTLQTLFDVFETSTRPTVDFVFNLKYIPCADHSKDYPLSPVYIDKKARGDMGDKEDFIELPSPEVSDRDDQTEVQSKTHRIDRDVESINVPEVDDTAHKIITELEDWKCQQMETFLTELKRKEVHHLTQLAAECERQKKEMNLKLQDKLDECSRLTESLEEAHISLRARAQKLSGEERALEKAKYELDKRYTVRFMEIEEKARRIKDDMDYQLKLQELRLKELQMEKNQVTEENVKLRTNLVQLEEDVDHLKRNTLPKEQLAGLFEDLREQSERYNEMEKSKRFYKEQWARLQKDVHKMKLKLLYIQEEKLKQSNCLGIDNIKGIQTLVFEERAALAADRNDLKIVRDALSSESDDSRTN